MAGFLFDRDFDQELEAEARVEAAPAPREAGPDPRLIAAQLAAAREAAYAEGEAAGFAAAEAELRAALESDIATTLAGLVPEIAAIRAELAAHQRQSSRDLAQMCHFLAERLLPELLERFGPRRLEAFCRRAARMAEGPAGAEIRLSPRMQAELAPVLGDLGTASGAPLRLVADPALSDGEARASWVAGRADYAAEVLHAELLSTLSSIAQSPAPDGL